MADVILTLNAGSSSLKLALFEAGGAQGVRARLRGGIADPGGAGHLVLRDAAGASVLDETLPGGTHDEYFPPLLDLLRAHLGPDHLVAAGHRVVHGGAAHAGPARVDDALLRELTALIPLAPLHQGHNLAPIEALRRLEPDLPQVACFDTSFHRTMPDVAARFALPREWEKAGVRRYGAHGLSYEYIASHLAATAPEILAGRVIVAHLGSGASLCAMASGRSVDTTMGMTPLDGLVMGTRSGALDPGVVLYLLTQGMEAGAVQDMLYHRSGLLGVSGISGDMRVLAESHEAPSRDAIELFVWRLAREAAAMAAALQGLDTLVFTGGIGEHSPDIREAAAERLAWLGVRLDGQANRAGTALVSAPDSQVRVLVIPTDEETVIARHTRRLLA